MKCRMCKGDRLYKFLDLGHMPPADDFKKSDRLLEPEIYYPLSIHSCDGCGLVQLGYIVPPEILYQNEYPYESSTTATGRQHWKRFASNVVEQFGLTASDLVVDIGSNVGVLLQGFKDCKVRVHGIDPAPNIVEIARANGIPTVCNFICMGAVAEVVAAQGQATVITGSNVFAHIDDLDSFVESIQHLLTKHGVLVLEFPYLVNLYKHLEYDTIYHEHLSYISIKPLVPFFKRFGMELFNVENVDIHGGSVRIYVGRVGQHLVSRVVQEMIDNENSAGIYSHKFLDRFAELVEQNRAELKSLLCQLKHEGKQIVAVSAPAKGMTLLNYCGLRSDTLKFVSEKSRLKIGRFTPGGNIPIVSDEELLNQQPDFALLLAWNFADEIISNLNEFCARGGKFIIPVPAPKIVG